MRITGNVHILASALKALAQPTQALFPLHTWMTFDSHRRFWLSRRGGALLLCLAGTRESPIPTQADLSDDAAVNELYEAFRNGTEPDVEGVAFGLEDEGQAPRLVLGLGVRVCAALDAWDGQRYRFSPLIFMCDNPEMRLPNGIRIHLISSDLRFELATSNLRDAQQAAALPRACRQSFLEKKRV